MRPNSFRFSWGRGLLQWGVTLGLGFALWAFMRLFLIEAFRVPSSSMEPGILPGDMVLVSKMAFGPVVANHHFPGFRKPKRGDLVVFESPETRGMMVVKRLVALPGDTIASVEGRLIVNGLAPDEPYLSSLPSDSVVSPVMSLRLSQWTAPYLVRGIRGFPPPSSPTPEDWGPLALPRGFVMVLGDNRGNSYDSRFWGLLPLSRIRGAPWLVYFSLDPYNGQGPRWERILKGLK